MNITEYLWLVCTCMSCNYKTICFTNNVYLRETYSFPHGFLQRCVIHSWKDVYDIYIHITCQIYNIGVNQTCTPVVCQGCHFQRDLMFSHSVAMHVNVIELLDILCYVFDHCIGCVLPSVFQQCCLVGGNKGFFPK